MDRRFAPKNPKSAWKCLTIHPNGTVTKTDKDGLDSPMVDKVHGKEPPPIEFMEALVRDGTWNEIPI